MRTVARICLLVVCLVAASAVGAQETTVKSFPAYGDAFESRISPDGRFLATFENGVIHSDEPRADILPIRIYDVGTGQPVETVGGEPDYTVDVAFSPDSTQIAALYQTGWLRVWTVADGETVTRLPIAPNGNALAWLSDSRVAVASGQLPTVHVWDVENGAMTTLLTDRFNTVGEMREALSNGLPDGLSAFAASPDGSQLAIATFYGRIQLWTLDGEMTTIYDPQAERPMLPIRALRFTPDGSRLLALDNRDGIVFVFDADSGEQLAEISGTDARGTALAISSNSERAAWLSVPEGEAPVITVAELASGETTTVPFPTDSADGWQMPAADMYFLDDGSRLLLSGRLVFTADDLTTDANPVYIIPVG